MRQKTPINSSIQRIQWWPALQRLVWRLPRPLRRHRITRLLARALFGTPYHCVEFDHSKIIGNVRDGEVVNTLIQRRFKDYGYFALARTLLAPGNTHLDVGANYGFHTFGLLGGAAVQSCRFVLVEPNPDCHFCHQASARLFPQTRFDCVHAAAAEHSGGGALVLDESSTGQAFIAPPGSNRSNGIPVAFRTLEEILRELEIDRVRLMKVDIEGSELAAFKGVADRLRAGAVEFIYFEVNPDALVRQRTGPFELIDYVRSLDFDLYWPHDSEPWIRHCYHSDPRDWRKPASRAITPELPVTPFEPSRYRPEPGRLFDLLAVHRKARAGPPA